MKLTLALSAAAIAVSQTASAATLNLTYEGSAAGYRGVTIDMAPVTVAGGPGVVAGGFDMKDSTPGGLGEFIAWCLDLGAYLGTNASYEYKTTETPFQNGGFNLVSAGMERVAAVFSANFGASVTSSADNSAAFQLALWEAVYDSDMSITTGAFKASSSGAVEALATQYLNAANVYDGASHWDLTYLESTSERRRQNLVTADPSPVPLPASGLMLLAAIGGIAAKRRKK